MKYPSKDIRFSIITNTIEQNIHRVQAFSTQDNGVIVIGAQDQPYIYLMNNDYTFNVINKYPDNVKLFGHCVVKIPSPSNIFL